MTTRRMVLVIAGHDPSGAAGVQADIEAISACGARCASLITALTAQNTGEFSALWPQRGADLERQANLLLSDLVFAACKIGLLGNAEIAGTVGGILDRLPGIPVVLDPVLRTGTGVEVADDLLAESLKHGLIPKCTVLTPNAAEATALTGCTETADAARRLLEMGARNVLVTGADTDTEAVVNTLYQQSGATTRFEYPRLDGVFHGSGCTLSASLAALLARGMELGAAVRQSQDFTWAALRAGQRIGRGQLHPDRLGMRPQQGEAK